MKRRDRGTMKSGAFNFYLKREGGDWGLSGKSYKWFSLLALKGKGKRIRAFRRDRRMSRHIERKR